MAIGTVINGMTVTNVGRRVVTIRPKAPEITVRVPDMVRVAGGTFSMGSERINVSQPVRRVTLSDFAIGKYPVTNCEYLDFYRVYGRAIPCLVADNKFAMHPVVNVSWKDASEYCAFLREITKTDESPSGRKFSLPTEAQWEFAAGGNEGRDYPWGNESIVGRVNYESGETTPVDAHPSGATPSGIFDMSGNVWEWVGDWYADKYDPNDITDPIGPEQGEYRILRGGCCYVKNYVAMRSAYGKNGKPGDRAGNIGFRLAENLTKEK